jgi:predicted RNA-binding protein with PUA domain
VTKRKPKRPRTATVNIKLELTECPVHGADVTNVEVTPPHEVAYEAPRADEKIAGAIRTSVGWSRAYADGWDRMFARDDDEIEGSN